jgi:hypothetical protein
MTGTEAAAVRDACADGVRICNDLQDVLTAVSVATKMATEGEGATQARSSDRASGCQPSRAVS